MVSKEGFKVTPFSEFIWDNPSLSIYSEQKNQFTKGQNLLVSQITAQGTKVKACEFYRTRIDTLSFVTPKYRTLVPAIGFIYILQWATHSESVFLHTLKLGLVTWITALNLKHHVSTSIAPLGIIYPTSKHALQHPATYHYPPPNGKSCWQAASQMNVSYSTVQRHYSSIGSSLPRYLSGCLTTLTTYDQQPLAQKVTSGAANTVPQLRKPLDLNVTFQAIRGSLRKAGFKSAGKPKQPVLARACRGGGWSLPWSTSTGL